jgi:hypothetical protein
MKTGIRLIYSFIETNSFLRRSPPDNPFPDEEGLIWKNKLVEFVAWIVTFLF